MGYAARNADEWDRLIGALDAFEAVETSASHVAGVTTPAMRASQVETTRPADAEVPPEFGPYACHRRDPSRMWQSSKPPASTRNSADIG
jgi:hypothetical protein